MRPSPDSAVPEREQWPDPEPHTEAGAVLTELIIAAFRLNGRLMETAQELAAAGGMTAAWWQVLGGALDQPRTVSDIGRRMGVTRQAVQRIANVLVEEGLAEFRTNPGHRRAQLLVCTPAGYWAIRQIALVQHPWANRVGATVGARKLHDALLTMRQVIEVLEADQSPAE